MSTTWTYANRRSFPFVDSIDHVLLLAGRTFVSGDKQRLFFGKKIYVPLPVEDDVLVSLENKDLLLVKMMDLVLPE